MILDVQVHQQHHAIFEAILRRQVYRAEAKMREHINVAAEHIERSYRTGNGATPPQERPA